MDSLFLLSDREFERYSPPAVSSKWWLRTPGEYYENTANINFDNDICYAGIVVNSDDVGVRPAMWIHIVE